MSGIVVLKLGGELIDTDAKRGVVADAIARAIATHRAAALIVVHGGGKDIDRALAAAGVEKRQVDGLRITDATTLEVVVGVLAGRVNTQLVAALNAAGTAAVGLTGADARTGLSRQATPHTTSTGDIVDLGLVGEPVRDANPALLQTLVAAGYVPVLASIGSTIAGGLLNVNADTLAAHVAASVGADRLVIAGATAGVLDSTGRTIAELTAAAVDALVAHGTATAGMIAKLRACERAIGGGVDEVLIIDGRKGHSIVDAVAGILPDGATRITAYASARTPAARAG